KNPARSIDAFRPLFDFGTREASTSRRTPRDVQGELHNTNAMMPRSSRDPATVGPRDSCLGGLSQAWVRNDRARSRLVTHELESPASSGHADHSTGVGQGLIKEFLKPDYFITYIESSRLSFDFRRTVPNTRW